MLTYEENVVEPGSFEWEKNKTEASTGNDSIYYEEITPEEEEAVIQEFEQQYYSYIDDEIEVESGEEEDPDVALDALGEEDDTSEEELNEAANLLEAMVIREVIIEKTPEEEKLMDEAAERIDEPKIEPFKLPNQVWFPPQLR